MHLQKLQILVPIGRKRAMPADLLEISDSVENPAPRERHLLGLQSLLPEESIYGFGSDGSQKFAASARHNVLLRPYLRIVRCMGETTEGVPDQ